MKGLPMAPAAKAAARTMTVCPYCDQPMLTRQRLW